MKRIDTELGEYLVYHVSEAGSPDAHDTRTGEWFYQPADVHDGTVFSEGFETESEATQAAYDWVDSERDNDALEWGPDSAQQTLERGPR